MRWTANERRTSLRANRVAGKVWVWAITAGGLGIVALVLALQLANRVVVLPRQELPDFAGVPTFTVLSLLLMAGPVAGVIEQASFRGYMQGPIERRHGVAVAMFVTGTMFGLAHLDFRLMLWPYVAVGSDLRHGDLPDQLDSLRSFLNSRRRLSTTHRTTHANR